ncbi:uncharacterized protein LOC120659781 [Panicum virgatum]|uniref:Uncharacterized protein n=1 Tax=Panicum virgatum TaxID=38727 RepID=A0A8T0VHK3_PANVG|nr:uncharacterized protein LOC120659781 [Panicum virgatum]KAG2632804.1 hypothetical protein PVAP13_2NG125500 [Panicum virgatum]
MARSGAGEEWRRSADTKTSEAAVEASTRPPGCGAGEVPHQRARLPYGPGADRIVGAIGYLVLCQKARPGTPAAEVAKVAVGHGDPAAGRDPEKRARGGY